MLVAIVPSSRSSPRRRRPPRMLSSAITPMTRSPVRIGTPSQDSASVPLLIAPSSAISAAVREPQRRPVADDAATSGPAPMRCGSLWIRSPSSISYGNVIMPVASSYDRDEHRARRRTRHSNPFADELDDRLEVELAGEGVADLVDERRAPRPDGAPRRSPGPGSTRCPRAARRTRAGRGPPRCRSPSRCSPARPGPRASGPRPTTAPPASRPRRRRRRARARPSPPARRGARGVIKAGQPVAGRRPSSHGRCRRRTAPTLPGPGCPCRRCRRNTGSSSADAPVVVQRDVEVVRVA